MAARAASSARRNATKKASPCVSTSLPPAPAAAARTIRRWSSRAAPYRSAPRERSSRVDPSTSLKRKVTVPLGRWVMWRERTVCRSSEARLGEMRGAVFDRGVGLQDDVEHVAGVLGGEDRPFVAAEAGKE